MGHAWAGGLQIPLSYCHQFPVPSPGCWPYPGPSGHMWSWPESPMEEGPAVSPLECKQEGIYGKQHKSL